MWCHSCSSTWWLILHRTLRRCMTWVHAPTTMQGTMWHPSTRRPTRRCSLAERWSWQACQSSTSRTTKRRTWHTNLGTRVWTRHWLHLRGIVSTHRGLGHASHRRCTWRGLRGETRLGHWWHTGHCWRARRSICGLLHLGTQVWWLRGCCWCSTKWYLLRDQRK